MQVKGYWISFYFGKRKDIIVLLTLQDEQIVWADKSSDSGLSGVNLHRTFNRLFGEFSV